jgi:hypothetical protein
VTETNGQTVTAPPVTMDIEARYPKPSEEVRKQMEAEAKKLEARQKKGKETLTINGKKLACEWVHAESGRENGIDHWASEVHHAIDRLERAEEVKNCDTTSGEPRA